MSESIDYASQLQYHTQEFRLLVKALMAQGQTLEAAFKQAEIDLEEDDLDEEEMGCNAFASAFYDRSDS